MGTNCTRKMDHTPNADVFRHNDWLFIEFLGRQFLTKRTQFIPSDGLLVVGLPDSIVRLIIELDSMRQLWSSHNA